jgi:hypothetical protein
MALKCKSKYAENSDMSKKNLKSLSENMKNLYLINEEI